MVGPGVKEYSGNQSQSTYDKLNVKYPMQNGIITNWQDMEKIWHHMFKELKVNPKNHPILLSESSDNPKNNREKMTQVL